MRGVPLHTHARSLHVWWPALLHPASPARALSTRGKASAGSILSIATCNKAANNQAISNMMHDKSKPCANVQQPHTEPRSAP